MYSINISKTDILKIIDISIFKNLYENFELDTNNLLLKKTIKNKINLLFLLDIIFNKTKKLDHNLETGVYTPHFKYDTFFLLKNNIKFNLFFDNKHWRCNILKKGIISEEEFIKTETCFLKNKIFNLYASNFVIIKNNLRKNMLLKKINLKYIEENNKFCIIKIYYKNILLCYLISCNIKTPLGLLETFHTDEKPDSEKICFLRNHKSFKYFCVLLSNWTINQNNLFLQDT